MTAEVQCQHTNETEHVLWVLVGENHQQARIGTAIYHHVEHSAEFGALVQCPSGNPVKQIPNETQHVALFTRASASGTQTETRVT